MLRKDGKFIQQRYLLDRNQQPIDVHEEEVSYVVGSGNHARSYLRHHPNGVITQLPVTWYSQQKRWDMSPGYDTKNHLDFSRAIPQGCVFCHTAYPRMDVEQIDDPHYFANPIPEGIGCERCHGPGTKHVGLALQGETGQTLKQAIYNPGRDTPEAQRTICYQCHMESSVDSLGTRVLKTGRDVFSFRPGEPFANYAVQFSLEAPDSKKLKVVQHAELMEASRCFQASDGRMTCTSCHDPHRKPAAADTASYYRTRCMQCHDSRKLSYTYARSARWGLQPLPHAPWNADQWRPHGVHKSSGRDLSCACCHDAAAVSVQTPSLCSSEELMLNFPRRRNCSSSGLPTWMRRLRNSALGLSLPGKALDCCKTISPRFHPPRQAPGSEPSGSFAWEGVSDTQSTRPGNRAL